MINTCEFCKEKNPANRLIIRFTRKKCPANGANVQFIRMCSNCLEEQKEDGSLEDKNLYSEIMYFHMETNTAGRRLDHFYWWETK